MSNPMRHLYAADGYLQLGLPDYALAELNAVGSAALSGPLEAPMQYMRGEALRAQGKYEAAIPALKRAAELIPAPLNRQVWMSLCDCFRQRGLDELAEVVQMFANSKDDARSNSVEPKGFGNQGDTFGQRPGWN